MNATEIITQALVIEQETINDFYSTAELYQWLNDALTEFINLSSIYKARFTITTVEDQADYSFPTGLMRPDKVWYGSDYDEMEAVDVRKLSLILPGWRGNDSGTPAYYYEELPQYLSVFPAPDAANASKTITILGVSVHPTVSAVSTIIYIPIQFHTSLTEYLLNRMKLKDDRIKEADVHYNRFRNGALLGRTDARQANRKDKRYSIFPSKIIKT